MIEEIQEHVGIALKVGMEVTHRLVSLLPEIQAHLVAGNPVGGLNVRVTFRPGGGPGEGPLVCDLDLNTIGSPEIKLNLAPSPQSGQLMLLPEAAPPGPPVAPPPWQPPDQPQPSGPTQYPAAQMRPAPSPLKPRRAQMPVPDGFTMPKDQPGLTGQLPIYQAPQGQDPESWSEAYNAQVAGQGAPAPQPVKRLVRPMFPGEATG